jgi:hypothetical protein
MGMTSSPVCRPSDDTYLFKAPIFSAFDTRGPFSTQKRPFDEIGRSIQGPLSRVPIFLMYTLFKLGILGKIYSSTSHGTYHGFFI